MREIEPTELSGQDGSKGVAWVGADGKVYDVSASRLWKGGKHVNRHLAGRDLSEALKLSPHGPKVLERVPEVGVLRAPGRPAAPAARKELPEPIRRILRAIPQLRRHPHPLMVHFPIALMYVGTAFAALQLALGVEELASAARWTIVAGAVGAAPAYVTGLWAWWVVWGFAPVPAIKWKFILGTGFVATAAGTAAWWAVDPDLLLARDGRTSVLAGLLCALSLFVSALGALGTTLTIPREAGE